MQNVLMYTYAFPLWFVVRCALCRCTNRRTCCAMRNAAARHMNCPLACHRLRPCLWRNNNPHGSFNVTYCHTGPPADDIKAQPPEMWFSVVCYVCVCVSWPRCRNRSKYEQLIAGCIPDTLINDALSYRTRAARIVWQSQHCTITERELCVCFIHSHVCGFIRVFPHPPPKPRKCAIFVVIFITCCSVSVV